MTPDIDTTDLYTDIDDAAAEALQSIADEYVRAITEGSPFATESWTENNGLPIEW